MSKSNNIMEMKINLHFFRISGNKDFNHAVSLVIWLGLYQPQSGKETSSNDRLCLYKQHDSIFFSSRSLSFFCTLSLFFCYGRKMVNSGIEALSDTCKKKVNYGIIFRWIKVNKINLTLQWLLVWLFFSCLSYKVMPLQSNTLIEIALLVIAKAILALYGGAELSFRFSLGPILFV